MSYFITLEGIEGVGKTSILPVIEAWFKQRQMSIVLTREPGGTYIGEQVRDILLSAHNQTLTSDAELLLMFAARAQHIMQVIQPALAQGKIVLSDRFIDASFAYQGGGRGVAQTRIEHLVEWLQPQLVPNLTILLDAPVDVALHRMHQRGKLDRFEQEQTTFFERVRNCYLQRAAQFPDRIKVIDAQLPLEQVSQLVEQLLATKFNNA
ncbi:MAG: dTMP kinase [Gammaproteobacteria bacterium]